MVSSTLHLEACVPKNILSPPSLTLSVPSNLICEVCCGIILLFADRVLNHFHSHPLQLFTVLFSWTKLIEWWASVLPKLCNHESTYEGKIMKISLIFFNYLFLSTATFLCPWFANERKIIFFTNCKRLPLSCAEIGWHLHLKGKFLEVAELLVAIN